MIDKSNIWVFLPAYNEATVIGSVIQEVKSCGFFNIVVIDDGSTDTTSLIAKEEGAHILRLCINRGVGAAIKTGILYAKIKNLEQIVFLDADGQHFPKDIIKLVNEMKQKNSDVVIGSRFITKESQIPFTRIIFNKVANLFTHFGKSEVSDSQSGFRLLNKTAIKKLELELDGYGTCTEMVWKINKLNLKLDETPIRVKYTKYSKSKGQNLWKGIQTAFYLIKNHLYEH
ncbi:MAG: glycosyltransferase family 2 protein [Flavobacteriaceae bacterium]